MGSHRASHADTIALYRRLIALKRAHPALNGGGIRWLHVSDDAVAFVRESAEECVLVVAARAITVIDLGAALPDDAPLIEGDVAWAGRPGRDPRPDLRRLAAARRRAPAWR